MTNSKPRVLAEASRRDRGIITLRAWGFFGLFAVVAAGIPILLVMPLGSSIARYYEFTLLGRFVFIATLYAISVCLWTTSVTYYLNCRISRYLRHHLQTVAFEHAVLWFKATLDAKNNM